ncbi:MAG TPA: phage GP46 family protein [Xanthobacteraceae bacterium]|nr:phage GP46 family protein [Xanthobacteraceae bacterium]
MPDIRIVQVGQLGGQEAVTLDWIKSTTALVPSQNGLDETQALVTAVTIALGTDRLADASDNLPIPGSSDRRGWWGDDSAADLWGGWPIGVRLWLMSRDKITDSTAAAGSTLAKAQAYVNECLQPFVDNKIISQFSVSLMQVNASRVDVQVTLYRGPLPEISLQYQMLWSELSASPVVLAFPPVPPALDYSDPDNSMYGALG